MYSYEKAIKFQRTDYWLWKRLGDAYELNGAIIGKQSRYTKNELGLPLRKAVYLVDHVVAAYPMTRRKSPRRM